MNISDASAGSGTPVLGNAHALPLATGTVAVAVTSTLLAVRAVRQKAPDTGYAGPADVRWHAAMRAVVLFCYPPPQNHPLDPCRSRRPPSTSKPDGRIDPVTLACYLLLCCARASHVTPPDLFSLRPTPPPSGHTISPSPSPLLAVRTGLLAALPGRLAPSVPWSLAQPSNAQAAGRLQRLESAT